MGTTFQLQKANLWSEAKQKRKRRRGEIAVVKGEEQALKSCFWCKEITTPGLIMGCRTKLQGVGHITQYHPRGSWHLGSRIGGVGNANLS